MCSLAEFEINGEKKFIEDTKVPLERVIDGGANQGDWSATLIQARPELQNIVLIEPNEDLNKALQSRFQDESKVTVKCFALDYRKDASALLWIIEKTLYPLSLIIKSIPTPPLFFGRQTKASLD